MTAAVVINAFQFLQIEDQTRHNYRAAYSYDTDNLFEIAISSDNSARRWVAPFYYLGELFPKSTLIVPDGGVSSWFPFESAVVAFGDATAVEEVPYDPEQFLDLDQLEDYRVNPETFAPDSDSARGLIDGRVSFYVNGEPSGIVIVMTPEGAPGRTEPLVFLDASVLEEDELSALGLQ